MGRNATPNAILKKTGSKKVRDHEPEFAGGIGAPPAILTGRALATWHETVAELASVGIGTKVEANALACYCLAVAELYQSLEDIEAHGRIVQTERGFTRNPACLNQNAAMGQIHKFASSFGLTPSSRSKVHGPPKAPTNDFDEI
jgi:P27 family predicted phage terminase small subunit